MPTYTDTHCHLDFEQFDNDREQVLQRAWDAGLVWILIPGVDLETNQAAINLAKAYPRRISAAVGIHPNHGKLWSDEIINELKTQALQPEVVAIGEIGLDYYREHTPFDQQRRMFKSQLELATELGLPVIIHIRDSSDDLMEILSAWHQRLVNANHPLAERPGVLHSYSEDLSTAQTAITMNFYIGISGPVTFTNAPDRKDITSQIPLEHLLLETDAPFLAPHPNRGKRNEPAYIPLIAKEIARLHHTSPEKVAEQTYTNAMRLFDLPAPPN